MSNESLENKICFYIIAGENRRIGFNFKSGFLPQCLYVRYRYRYRVRLQWAMTDKTIEILTIWAGTAKIL